jgi:hypothetical protein
MEVVKERTRFQTSTTTYGTLLPPPPHLETPIQHYSYYCPPGAAHLHSYFHAGLFPPSVPCLALLHALA